MGLVTPGGARGLAASWAILFRPDGPVNRNYGLKTVAPLGQRFISSGVLLENVRGGFEEQVARRPLVGSGALYHEDGHHAVSRVHRQIGAVSAVVAKEAVAQMIAKAVVDLIRSVKWR